MPPKKKYQHECCDAVTLTRAQRDESSLITVEVQEYRRKNHCKQQDTRRAKVTVMEIPLSKCWTVPGFADDKALKISDMTCTATSQEVTFEIFESLDCLGS